MPCFHWSYPSFPLDDVFLTEFENRSRTACQALLMANWNIRCAGIDSLFGCAPKTRRKRFPPASRMNQRLLMHSSRPRRAAPRSLSGHVISQMIPGEQNSADCPKRPWTRQSRSGAPCGLNQRKNRFARDFVTVTASREILTTGLRYLALRWKERVRALFLSDDGSIRQPQLHRELDPAQSPGSTGSWPQSRIRRLHDALVEWIIPEAEVMLGEFAVNEAGPRAIRMKFMREGKLLSG